MKRNNPPRNSEALIERIRRLSDEAEWSVDELREVLMDAGIDPDQFIKDIKTGIKELLNASPERPEQNAQIDFDSLPLLPRLRRITGLKATAIAEKMGAPVPFLSDLSSHPNVIPFRARKEFARRAANSLPGVSERDVLDSFERGLRQQAAAFRDGPFPDEGVDFEKIVRRSDMSADEQRYWLSLSEESPE
ncbi:MAG TPA: hypothetical protein VG324_03420 [Blastocatellia bacterium]|nr:hypothetical protein [Blastocatellia bacterium]